MNLVGGLRSSVEALPEVNAVQATTAAADYVTLAAHQGACPLTQRAASSTSLQVEKRVVGGVELLCWYCWWTGPPFSPLFMV